MEIKTPDTEKIEEIKTENYPEEVEEIPEAEAPTESESVDEAEPEEVEWIAIKKHKSERPVEEEQNDSVPEPEIMPEPIDEPSLEVVSEEEIQPIEVVEDITPSSKELAKKAKQARKAARKEVKENEVDYEDDGSIFKTKSFRRIWNLVSFILLIAAIALPVGLLIYIIMHYFL